jgi:hypothetical protein
MEDETTEDELEHQEQELPSLVTVVDGPSWSENAALFCGALFCLGVVLYFGRLFDRAVQPMLARAEQGYRPDRPEPPLQLADGRIKFDDGTIQEPSPAPEPEEVYEVPMDSRVLYPSHAMGVIVLGTASGSVYCGPSICGGGL